MKQKFSRILALLLTAAILASMCSGMVFADDSTDSQEVFPENSIAELDDDEELGAAESAEEFEFSYVDDDDEELGDAGDIEVPDDNASPYIDGDDEDLGAAEEVYPENCDSAPSDIDEDEDLGATDVDESNYEEGEAWSLEEDSSAESDDDEELGATGVSLSVSASTVVVGKGNTADVTVSITGTNSTSYTITPSYYSSYCTTSWGTSSNNGRTKTLHIKGVSRSGSNIYLYLKNSSGNVVASKTIYVYVFSDSYISVANRNVSLNRGSAKNITFSVKNYGRSVYLKYSTTNTSAYTVTWGNWYNGSINATIKGVAAGSGTITVNVFDYATKKYITSTKISVSVTSAKLSLSSSKVSVASGSSTQVKVTASNYTGRVYLTYAYSSGSASNLALSFGNATGSTWPLTLNGKNIGSGTVYIYLKEYSTGNLLATSHFQFSVYSNVKITPSPTSVSVTAGSSKKVSFTVSGVSSNYYLSYAWNGQSYYSASSPGYSYSTKTGSVTIYGKNQGSGSLTIYVKNSSYAIIAQTTIPIAVAPAPEKPSVSASSSSVSVNVGASSTIQITYKNVSTSVYLEYSSTNTSAYKVTWGSQSGNSKNMTITGLEKGTGYINVYLRRSSDKVTLASTKIYVQINPVTNKIDNVTYSFENFSKSATLKICQMMFGNTSYARTVYNWELGDGGNCFGMSTTSGLFYKSGNGVNVSDYKAGASVAKNLSRSSYSSKFGITTEQFVQAMQIAQVVPGVFQSVSGSNIKNLVSAVKQSVDNNQLVCVGMNYPNHGGHEVIAFGVDESSSTVTKLLIYDNNWPGETRYMYLYKSNGVYTGWSYTLWAGETWASSTGQTLDYTPYSTYLSLWNNRGNLKTTSSNLLVSNTRNFAVYDIYDNLIATVEDGVLTTENEEITAVDAVSYLPDAEDDESVYGLYLPVDVYTIKNIDEELDSFDLEMVNMDLGTRISTTGDEVTLCADDECDFAACMLESPEEGETYSITLMSSLDGEPESVQWDGIADGETISTMINDGNVEECNTAGAEMSLGAINDGSEDPVSYRVFVNAGANGTCDSEEVDYVLSGNSRTYTFTPDEGYEVENVTVDDIDIGAATEYTLEDVTADHSIYVTFKRTPCTEHTWDEGVVTTEATYDAEGVKTYTCTVCGETKTEVIPQLDDGSLRIVSQPDGGEATLGQTVTISVEAVNAASYQWFYSKDGGTTWKKLYWVGAKTNTLSVEYKASRTAFQYKCQVTGTDGTTLDTDPTSITQGTAPDVVITEETDTIFADIGETVSFTITAENAVTYQWFYSSDNGATWSKLYWDGAQTDTLTFEVKKSRYNYIYYCKLTDGNGTAYYSDRVHLLQPMSLTKQPKNVTAAIGDTVNLTVSAVGVASYQWYYSKDDGTTWNKLYWAGARTDTLTVQFVQKRSNFIYHCVLVGNDGSEETTNTVKITAAG